MARSLDLNILTSQPDSYRDNDWEQAFFQAFVDGKVQLEQADPRPAADGWPYLYVRTGGNASEPTVKVLDWLSTRGIGLIVNGHKDVADYVFPWGLIWNFKERSQFISPATSVPVGRVELKEGDKIITGPPTFEFLPKYVREILMQFLLSQEIKDPKILLVSQDSKNYDLCFSLESLGSPPEREHRGIAETLAWFLPQHYSILLMSEKGLPSFIPLAGGR